MTFKKARGMVVAVSAVALAAVIFGVAQQAAQAQERESPLKGQPAVRHRLLLRKYRFEIAPLVGFQFLGEYNTAILPGAKVAFHFNDWLAVQAFGLYGVTVNSGLTGQIEEVYTRNAGRPDVCAGGQFLNCQPTTNPESAQSGLNDPAAFRNRLARVNGHFGGGVSFSPFFGKMALFGKVFFQYDIYALVGVGIVSYTNSYAGPEERAPNNTGAKVGPNFGAGLHLFLNNWFAINFEFRDTIVRNNISGGDNNGDFVVNGDDVSPRNEFVGLLGVAFYLPTKVGISP